jgi:hypothetical protein
MPHDPTRPGFVGTQLAWDSHSVNPVMTFWVRGSAFKDALGLRPRVREDEKVALAIARKNWVILERIAEEAVRLGAVKRSSASKDWHVHWTIDDSVFMRLFEQYESEIVR